MTMQQSSIKTSFAHRAGSYQPSKTLLAWACVITAVATMIVGFSWGGWVTGGSSDKRASVAAHDAAVAALASICVDRFRAQGDAAVKLVELSKVSTWERGSFIERSGFALMPGSKTADSDVARACAEGLATPTTPKT